MGVRARGRLLHQGLPGAVPHIEYPAIYHKERVVGHLRSARAGETEEQTKARSGQDIAALLASPFFDLWARAAISEIVSALHERVVTGA